MSEPITTTATRPLPARTVLVVDDDPVIRRLVHGLLERRGCTVRTAGSGIQAEAELQRGPVDLVVLDLLLPDMHGTEVFQRARMIQPDCTVIFLTDHGSTDLALSSIQQGAFEFIEKPHLTERLLPAVESAFAALSAPLAPEWSERGGFGEIITQAASMRAVFRALQNAVSSTVPVLIRGESGTGKELVAKAIHQHGPRRGGPFVAVNCAGIPDNLLEAEFFGYERGSFTGADRRKLGKFELADGGTLFLDEIGEMQPALQAKLLRVIQEGEYQRLGGLKTLRADVRILSATHRNLEEDVRVGRFREDLYYRLAVFSVDLPPLRERDGDVPLLAAHFIERFARREEKEVRGLDPRAAELLESYSYAGNVRELENIIAYGVVSSRGPMLTIADLPPAFLEAVAAERGRTFTPPFPQRILGGDPDPAPPADSGTSSAAFSTLDEVERRHVQDALRQAQGNKAEAARLLGISRMTLYRKLKAYAQK